MNTMTLERIEHEEAKRAADRTGRVWTDLIDFESLRDLKRDIERKGYDEETAREVLAAYFENLVTDLEYCEEQEADDAD